MTIFAEIWRIVAIFFKDSFFGAMFSRNFPLQILTKLSMAQHYQYSWFRHKDISPYDKDVWPDYDWRRIYNNKILK